MQLKSLRIFEAVSSTGSFGAAAQRLHLFCGFMGDPAIDADDIAPGLGKA